MKYDFEKQAWFDTEKYSLEGFELVDLSDSIEEHSEVPGEQGYSDPDVLFDTKPWVTLAIKPYYITKIVIGAHTGTHVDAPMHVKEDGDSIDRIPNEFIGPSVIIDVNDSLDENNLNNKLLKVNQNSIIVIRGKSDYKISDEFRKQIIRSRPRIVVFGDCVNVDGVEDTIQYLSNDIPMVMGANQSAVDTLNDGDIIFVMPLKYKGIEAAPVRMFALKLRLTEKKETEIDFSMEDEN